MVIHQLFNKHYKQLVRYHLNKKYLKCVEEPWESGFSGCHPASPSGIPLQSWGISFTLVLVRSLHSSQVAVLFGNCFSWRDSLPKVLPPSLGQSTDNPWDMLRYEGSAACPRRKQLQRATSELHRGHQRRPCGVCITAQLLFGLILFLSLLPVGGVTKGTPNKPASVLPGRPP